MQTKSQCIIAHPMGALKILILISFNPINLQKRRYTNIILTTIIFKISMESN